MITEIATLTITPGREAEFETAFCAAQQYLADSPHCLSFQVLRCVEQPNRFVLRNVWDSLEGHTELFRGSPAYQEYRTLIYPLYAEPPEVLHYEDVPLPALSGE
ncbi:MAG: antibiotic biosynthesis monooxygenase [Chloroflexota bacterium]